MGRAAKEEPPAIRLPDAIEHVPIDSLRAYPKNARTHSKAQITKIAQSMREYGWTVPVLVTSDGEVVGGHGRIEAAKLLGLATVPVIELSALTPEQVRAYRILDNQLTILGDWDEDVLASELRDLRDLNFDVGTLGFDDADLASLLGPIETDEVPAPAPPEHPVSRLGDVWVLGDRHRVMCGDAGNAQHVDRLLAGQPIHLIHSDPPYNVKVEPRSNNAIAAGLSSFPGAKHHQAFDLARHPGKSTLTHARLRAKDRPLLNDNVSDAEFAGMLAAWFGNMARVLLPGHPFYIWGGYMNLGSYPPVLEAAGLYWSQSIVWTKGHPVLGRKDYMCDFEMCFYGWREGAAHKFYGPHNLVDVWPVKKVNPQSMVHLTEKPVELAVRAIEYSSRRGENVLDLFGGSGSTLIGAEQTRRRAYVMELDAAYADVIVERWQESTGQKAFLDGVHKTFEEVRAERLPHAEAEAIS